MLHQLNIFIHVLAGIIAMGFGVAAYATLNKGNRHRRFGRLFLVGMGVVILTAVNGVLNFVDRPFLTVVTLQSAYLAWTGWRAVIRKSQPLSRGDLGLILIATAFVIRFFWLLQGANIIWNQGVVWYLLAYLVAILAFDLIRYLRPILINNPRFWLYDHLFRMTGAFTALVSAGVGTVMGNWGSWSQILPATLGTLWLIFALGYFPRRIKSLRREAAPPSR
ncbi:MAG: hypothetical protein AAF597_00455 [Bacteroidota bacterium]